MMKPVKRAVALVIRRPDDTARVLTVLRPADDEHLPSTWGLPAASPEPGEDWADAAARIGPEKLGVEVRIAQLVGEGRLERDPYILHMREFEGSVVKGEPEVPQPTSGVTQYRAWAWADPDRLRPAAREGSLCSRILLEHVGRSW